MWEHLLDIHIGYPQPGSILRTTQGRKGRRERGATLQVQLDPKRRQLILQEIQDEAASRTKENIRWNLLHPVKAMNMCIHIIYLLIDLFID